MKYGIEQNYLLSQKAVEGHSYGSRDKDSKERSTKHPKETSYLYCPLDLNRLYDCEKRATAFGAPMPCGLGSSTKNVTVLR